MKITGKILQVKPALYNGEQRTFETREGKKMEVWNVCFAISQVNKTHIDCLLCEYVKEKDNSDTPFRAVTEKGLEVTADVSLSVMESDGRTFQRIRISNVYQKL